MIYNLKDVVESSKRERFNVISTFAGGGGSSTGYRLAGGKILCINEFVEEAQNTYKETYFSNASIVTRPATCIGPIRDAISTAKPKFKPRS